MNARIPNEVTCKGFVIGNGDGSAYRTLEQGVPVWTPDREKALHFARRCDAELYCREDEDAWHIYPVATIDLEAPTLRDLASALIRDAESAGLVIAMWQISLPPLAMGRYITVCDVREQRPRAE